MTHMKIACSPLARRYMECPFDREWISLDSTDCTDISAAVVTDAEPEYTEKVCRTCFGIPIFIITDGNRTPAGENIHDIPSVLWESDPASFAISVERAAAAYEDQVLPPFFQELTHYVYAKPLQFDCPGHQSGDFFRRTPAGRAFVEFFGDRLFRADLCNADVKLGDLLIHEGPAFYAQQHAAQVYHADKTYFVLNGTSTANKIALQALLAPGDLVLYDRNNHKSIDDGALVQLGAIPVYLETARNPFGFIGGIPDRCFEENYLRKRAAVRDPQKAKQKRPFRLAVIQLGTYDGTIYNARQVVNRIGHLCDYILFDSAWVGYEQFIPMMKDCSPLLLQLGPEDPGILVTQSVHKQQAGFSQTSQIHKKDSHIAGQERYVNHKRFNNAYMLMSSTSPFYPLFASLDVNARMVEGKAGPRLWMDALKTGIEARKMILRQCHMIRPFIPPEVHGHPWEEGKTEEMAYDMAYFRFNPGEKWHSFEGYGKGQYFVDPMKLQLTTPGICAETGEYEDFGIHASILANYLREQNIIPEKCDLNSILFLLTPAEDLHKMKLLTDALVRFESLIDDNVPMQRVLPEIYDRYLSTYKGHTIQWLCREMQDFYRIRNVKDLQKKLFLEEYFPSYAMSPFDAHVEFVKNHGELVPISDIEGRIALEGALPYPPGILTVIPGERWSQTAQQYFLALIDGMNQLPGFAPEIQGVYIEEEGPVKKACGYVLKQEYEKNCCMKTKNK